MDLVTEVEEWPYGIKFARWDEGTQVDWDWLKILEHLLAPGQEDSVRSFSVSQIFNIVGLGLSTMALQYTRGVTAGIKSVRIPADLGWSIRIYSCE